MTLDSKHNEKMTSFQNIKNVEIPKLIAKKKELKIVLSVTHSNIRTVLSLIDSGLVLPGRCHGRIHVAVDETL